MAKKRPSRQGPPGKPGRRGKTTPAKIDRAKLQKRALDLRAGGTPYAEIGTALGCTYSVAYRLVAGALHKMLAPPAREVLALHIHRLDALLASRWTRALAGDDDAFDRVLKVLAQRARISGLLTHAPDVHLTQVNVDASTQVAHIEDRSYLVADEAGAQAYLMHLAGKERAAALVLDAKPLNGTKLNGTKPGNGTTH